MCAPTYRIFPYIYKYIAMELGNIKKIVVNGQVYGIEDERARQMIAEEIAKVVGGAPETFDTLKEIADYIEVHGLDMAEIIAGVEANTQAVSEEASRAKAAEKLLEGQIAAEKARAEQAEKANATAISTEATRAKAAEKANAEAIAGVKDTLTNEISKLKDGDTIVGQAREIHSRNGKTVTDSFLARTTAGSGTIGDGVATLKQIGGNIVKNLVDGTFTSGWRDINGSFERIGEIAKITATQKNGGIMYSRTSINSHKYYGVACMYSNDDDVYMFVSNAVSGGNGSTVTKGNWGRSSWYSTGTGGSITVRLITKNLNAVLYAAKPRIINLTETFGEGNEPDQATCDKLFGTMDALPQGLTIANPTEFKSTGFNQFNPDMVLKGKAIVDGAIVDGDKTLAIIPCLPCKIGEGENNGYCIHGAFDEGAENVYLTPLNPLEVEGELYLCELTKDADKGTYVPQIKGYMLVEVPNATDLCVHFLWSEDRGRHDFEPYYESKVELPAIPEMPEYGLAGIQTSGTLVCDEIDFEKSVYRKKIGAVDLGSLDWIIKESTSSDNKAFLSSVINGMLTQTGYNLPPRLMCKSFTSIKSYHIDNPAAVDNSIWIHADLGNKVYVKSSAYTTEASFKAAMQGVMLYYELAEPIEYPLPKVNNNYTSSDYGVEQFDGGVPCNANNLYYMRSLAGETRNFLDRMYANTGKEESPIAVADYITEGIADNKAKAEEAPNLALRSLFIAAGAEYNDTDNVIMKTAPWGESVEHLPKHYYLNGLGDITEKEMMTIYLAKPITSLNSACLWMYSKFRTNLSQFLPEEPHNLKRLLVTNTKIQVVNNSREIVCDNVSSMFGNCVGLHSICPVLDIGKVTSVGNTYYMFENTPKLVRVKVKNLKYNFTFASSPLLDKASVLYLIQNAAPTNGITITLHADAYARLAEDADIVAALAAQPLITLVSA